MNWNCVTTPSIEMERVTSYAEESEWCATAVAPVEARAITQGSSRRVIARL
jgi:hypothetical protein